MERDKHIASSAGQEKKESEMFNAICSLIPQLDYRLRLTYADGETVMADFGPLVRQGGVFAPLADPAFFAQASLDERGRVVQWPGELEFCADALRQQSLSAAT